MEAPGVHLAAQRVLAALLQETALAQKEGAADDAAAACVAWLACAHLDFPVWADPSKRDDDDGAVSASRLLADAREGEEDDALALEMSRAVAERAAQSAKQGGPHGPMVVAMVESLVRGGAARFARRARAAAAQREAGSMFGFVSETGGVNVSEARHASPEAVSAAGIACVEVLGERCPALAEQLAFVLDSASSAGSLEDAGPATAARARVLAARLRAVAESARAFGEPNVRKSRSPVPSLAADPRRARRWNRRLSCSRTSEPGTARSPRGAGSPATRGARAAMAAAAAAAAAADVLAVLSAARDAVEAATRLVAAAARARREGHGRRVSVNGRRVNRRIDIGIRPFAFRADAADRPERPVLDRGVARVAPRRASRASPSAVPPAAAVQRVRRRGLGGARRHAAGGHARPTGVRGRHRGTHRRALRRRGAGEGGRGSARRRRSRRRRRRRRRRVRVHGWKRGARRPRRVARRSRRRRGDAGDGGGARPRVRARRATPDRDVRGVSERHIRVEPGVRRRRRPRGGSRGRRAGGDAPVRPVRNSAAATAPRRRDARR